MSTLDDIITNGNVSSNTIHLTHETGMIASGNIEASKFIGDGTSLTGVALGVDLLDNSSRIDTISIDLLDNAQRIDQLFNTDLALNSTIVGDIITNLQDNSSRIDDLEIDLANNSSRIDVIIADLADNASRMDTVIIDLDNNSSRIDTVSNNLIDNSFRIENVSTDLADNSIRIDVLNTNITDNSSRIDTLNINLVDNSSRIDIVSANIDNFVVTLDDISGFGNVTANTLQLTNETTGLVVTGNVEASKFIGDGTLLTGIALETDFVDNVNRIDTIITNLGDNSSRIVDLRTDVDLNTNKISFINSTHDTKLITSNLDITGNIFVRGDRFVVESETKLINDAIIGIANNNTIASTDVGILMQRPTANVALIHHG